MVGRGRAGRRSPSHARIAAPGSDERDRDDEEEEAGRERRVAPTPSLPRKLTKNASRTASPLIVNGTSMTRKSSGPIT